MLLNLDTLTSHALALPPDERLILAERLWESVEAPTEDDEDLFAEIERREAEIKSGAVKPIPFDRAMSEIRIGLE